MVKVSFKFNSYYKKESLKYFHENMQKYTIFHNFERLLNTECNNNKIVECML